MRTMQALSARAKNRAGRHSGFVLERISFRYCSAARTIGGSLQPKNSVGWESAFCITRAIRLFTAIQCFLESPNAFGKTLPQFR